VANLLEMKDITKIFPGVIANDNINLEIEQGEVHALLGENGSGKSTLMNILSGLYKPTAGRIFINGEEVSFNSPRDAIHKGIGMVYQHFMLIRQLSVVENIILGMPQKYEPLLDIKDAVKKITEFSSHYGMNIDPYSKIWQLSVGQQQRVEIIKVLYRGAKLLILDEPTSVLTPQEVDELFSMINQFLKKGCSVIFISHKIDEVETISNRITVLRQGKKIGIVSNNTSKKELARMMVGREVSFKVDKLPANPGKVILKLEGVEALNDRRLKALKSISMEIYKGEILGIAGVDGNGQSELVEVITGLRKINKGKISISGINVTNLHPRKILELNVGHIPQDRHLAGMVLDMDLKENMILHDYYIPPHCKGKFLNWDFIKKHTCELIKEYEIKTPSEEVLSENLSGGNQQKLILARELHRKPDLLIAMNATRGLDVGAIEYVQKKIIELRDRGAGILYISTEIEEIINMSDRIAVIYNGEMMGIVRSEEVSIEELGLMMAGTKKEEVKSII